MVFLLSIKIEIMRDNKPSRTALKVALVIVTLGAKPGMVNILPPDIVQASQELLLASGAVGPRTIRWADSRLAVSVYEALTGCYRVNLMLLPTEKLSLNGK